MIRLDGSSVSSINRANDTSNSTSWKVLETVFRHLKRFSSGPNIVLISRNTDNGYEKLSYGELGFYHGPEGKVDLLIIIWNGPIGDGNRFKHQLTELKDIVFRCVLSQALLFSLSSQFLLGLFRITSLSLFISESRFMRFTSPHNPWG